MPAGKKLKLTLAVGGAVGALLGISITLMLDTLYAGNLGGTWRDAIAQDLQAAFSLSYPAEGFIVSSIFVIIILVLGAIGALLGAASSVLVVKFLELLARD